MSSAFLYAKHIQEISQYQHENAVQFYFSFVVREEVQLITTTMRRGNCCNGVFDEITIVTVLHDVLNSSDYFQSNGRIHRYKILNSISVSAFIASGGNLLRVQQKQSPSIS